MIKDDGHVLHFPNPKGESVFQLVVGPCDVILLLPVLNTWTHLCFTVQASLSANTFAISGNCEEKR